jgi:peroxiredoxin
MFSKVSLVLTVVAGATGAWAAPDSALVTKAAALLSHSDEVLAGAKTLEAKYTQIDAYPSKYRDLRQEATVDLERPGDLRIAITRARRVQASDPWKDTGNNTLTVVSPGSRYAVFFHLHSTQVRKEASPTSLSLPEAPVLNAFFTGKTTPAIVLQKAAAEGGLEDVQVKDNQVQFTIGSVRRTVTLGPDGLIHHLSVENLDTKEVRTWDLESVSLNKTIPDSRFHFVPPADAIPFDKPIRAEALEVGSEAPDFELPDVAGHSVRLSDFRGKVVVLKFWATWCWPCNQSLPETESLAAEYGKQGVETVAVAIKDSRTGLNAWIKKHPAYRDIRFAFEDPTRLNVSTAYRVQTTPTVFVIDRTGHIAAEIDGYTGPTPTLQKAIQSAL